MKKSIGVAIASALLVTLAACSGGSGTDTKSEATADAAAAAKSETSADLTKDNFVDRLSAAQKKAGSAQIEMNAAAMGTKAVMKGSIDVGDTVEESKTQMTMDLGMMKMDVRLVDGVMYLGLGELTGGKFVKVDLNDPNDELGKQYGGLTDQLDPEAQLKQFETAMTSFKNEGDGGKIDGVETTKLALTVDTDKIIKSQGEDASKLGAGMPKELTYTIYVGSDDLMRRMVVGVGGSDSTINWTKWGEPVKVEVPAKSEITDSSVLKGLGASLGG